VIAYLSSKGMCPEGFEATRDKRRELVRTQWIAERRKEEEAAIGAWETEVVAMTLTGSVKQVGFARRVRSRTVGRGRGDARRPSLREHRLRIPVSVGKAPTMTSHDERLLPRVRAAADVDPISTLVGDRGRRLAQHSDDLWDVVGSWPDLASGAIPVVTTR